MTTPKTLIDRDEVIKIISDEIITYTMESLQFGDTKILENITNEDLFNAWKEDIGRIKSRIEKIPTESQWIDVKERLPKKNGYYLVCFHKSLSSDGLTARVCEQFYKKRLNNFGNITGSNGWRPGDITHYQPLPLPPQQ